jgi:hypothetical protein
MPTRRESSNLAALRNRIGASVAKASRRRSTSWVSRTFAEGPGRDGPATNDAPEAASQAAGSERGTAATHAYAHWGTGSLLAGCPNRTLPLLRDADERSSPKLVSWGSSAPVVEDLATLQSEALAVAPPAAIHPTLVPLGPYLSSLSATAPVRCHPRREPDALVAPVRIWGGGREQSRSLLRPGT